MMVRKEKLSCGALLLTAVVMMFTCVFFLRRIIDREVFRGSDSPRAEPARTEQSQLVKRVFIW